VTGIDHKSRLATGETQNLNTPIIFQEIKSVFNNILTKKMSNNSIVKAADFYILDELYQYMNNTSIKLFLFLTTKINSKRIKD
jgi:hypothetical protein